MASGHGNPFDDSPGTDSDTSLPGTVSALVKALRYTVLPTGTAPGCQVTVARPSSVWTLPAMPRRTVCIPIETGGSGAATMTSVVSAVADVEPPFPIAVTTSERVVPMSSGVSVRFAPIACGMATQDAPLALQRRQR